MASMPGRKMVADVGIASRPLSTPSSQLPGQVGTDNFLKGPAMSREEAIQAIEVGIKLVQEQIEKGARLVATGNGHRQHHSQYGYSGRFNCLDAARITGETNLDEA